MGVHIIETALDRVCEFLDELRMFFEKESFELLENILEEAGELDTRVPYEDLVNTEFAKMAAGK